MFNKTCSIEQCDRRHYARGLCERHYKKRELLGLSRLAPNKDVESRFWKNVDRRGDDECWPWKTAESRHGYGNLWVGDRVRKGTHVSLFLATGKWPTQDVLHSCDYPPCVNPKHLREGTHLENMREAIERGRFPELQGANFAKLTKDQVAVIRHRSRAGESVRSLAFEFNVSKQTVWRIRENMTWKMDTMRAAVNTLDDVQEIAEQ